MVEFEIIGEAEINGVHCEARIGTTLATLPRIECVTAGEPTRRFVLTSTEVRAHA